MFLTTQKLIKRSSLLCTLYLLSLFSKLISCIWTPTRWDIVIFWIFSEEYSLQITKMQSKISVWALDWHNLDEYSWGLLSRNAGAADYRPTHGHWFPRTLCQPQLPNTSVLTMTLNFIPTAEGIAIDWLKCWLTTLPQAMAVIMTASAPHKEMCICLCSPSDQQSSWISNNQRVFFGPAACCKAKFIVLKQRLLANFFLISCLSEVQRPISHFTVTFNKN